MGAQPRHAVEVWHEIQRVSMQAGAVPALLVGEEYQDVGAGWNGGGHGYCIKAFVESPAASCHSPSSRRKLATIGASCAS